MFFVIFSLIVDFHSPFLQWQAVQIAFVKFFPPSSFILQIFLSKQCQSGYNMRMFKSSPFLLSRLIYFRTTSLSSDKRILSQSFSPSFNLCVYILNISMNHSISSTSTGKTKIKIVFLGGQSVGKSSVIQKYIHDRFDQTANPTVGIDFLAKNVSHKSKYYRLQLWDTAGQERFRSLIPSYLKDAHCALIVFDVTSAKSLAETQTWVSLFNENKSGEGFVFLLGNKIDLDYREVSKQEGKQKAQSLGVPYFQISAKSGQGIDELFIGLIQHSTQKTSNPLSLERPSIKQEPIRQEQEKKPSAEQTDTKLTVEMNQGVQISENVVLKNEKINNKNQKNKGCC